MDTTEMRDKLRQLVSAAVVSKPVKLASGKTSDFYIDGRQVILKPDGAYYTACIMADLLGDVQFDAVGGVTMGADPIVGALCYHLFVQKQADVTCFIVRKEEKGHGLQKRIEGPVLTAGARAVIVEDVVTSGESVRRAAAIVEETGATVVKMLALVDREEGAAENLQAAGYDFKAIFSRRELMQVK